MGRVLLLNGNPTGGGVDGELVDADNPVRSAALATGADDETAPIALAVRTETGYRRDGPTAIEPTSDRWALAPDDGGAPGTWCGWGEPLLIAEQLAPENVVVWVKARVTSDESYAVAFDDADELLVPSDAYQLTTAGRSLVIRSSIIEGVGRTLGITYDVDGITGRSLDVTYYLIGAVGASLDVGYGVTGAVGASLDVGYDVLAAVGASLDVGYDVLAAVGASLDVAYSVVNTIFEDDFASIDTANWLAITSGSATVVASGGKAVITKNSTANVAHLIEKSHPLAHGGTWTVTALVDLSNGGASDYQHPVLALARKSSAPTSGDTFTDVYFPLRIELYRYSVDAHNYFRFKYVNTGGTAVWFDFGGGGAWSTTFDGATDGSGSWVKLPSDTAQYRYMMQADATNGVRMLVKSADGATTYGTSAWVPWSSINGSGSYYIAFGAWQYSFTTAFSGVMNVDRVDVVP